MYEWMKATHVVCTVLTILFFTVRGIILLRNPMFTSKRWVRRTAESIDTLLFVSGITMAWMASLAPWQEPWLAAKLGLLLLYILFGMVAFHWSKTTKVRFGAWLMALFTFAMIVLIAVGKGV